MKNIVKTLAIEKRRWFQWAFDKRDWLEIVILVKKLVRKAKMTMTSMSFDKSDWLEVAHLVKTLVLKAKIYIISLCFDKKIDQKLKFRI